MGWRVCLAYCRRAFVLASLSLLYARSLRPLGKVFPFSSRPPARFALCSFFVRACLRVVPARSSPQNRFKNKGTPMLLRNFARASSPETCKSFPVKTTFRLPSSLIFRIIPNRSAAECERTLGKDSLRRFLRLRLRGIRKPAALAEATGNASAPRWEFPSRKKRRALFKCLRRAPPEVPKCSPTIKTPFFYYVLACLEELVVL